MNVTLNYLLALIMTSTGSLMLYIAYLKQTRLHKKAERDLHAEKYSHEEFAKTQDVLMRLKNKRIYALIKNNEDLSKSKLRMSAIIRKLRKREDPVELSLTWLETPDTDINVCKVRVREQLGIELENAGAIKYSIDKWNDPKMGGIQLRVTARIKLLNTKYDKQEAPTENL